MNVLVVDDSRTMRDMVSFTLESTGKFKCIQASDGSEAISLLKANPSSFQLVITDLNMPNMDGLEFIKQTRMINELKFTPILMLTTESDGNKRELGKQAGATGWLVKPFDPTKLVSTVEKVIGG